MDNISELGPTYTLYSPQREKGKMMVILMMMMMMATVMTKMMMMMMVTINDFLHLQNK